MKGTSSKFQPISMLSTYDPFSFTERKFYGVNTYEFKLSFSSLFTHVECFISENCFVRRNALIFNNSKLFIVIFCRELTYLAIFFDILKFLGIILASFIQGGHFQVAVVTLPSLQIKEVFLSIIPRRHHGR